MGIFNEKRSDKDGASVTQWITQNMEIPKETQQHIASMAHSLARIAKALETIAAAQQEAR